MNPESQTEESVEVTKEKHPVFQVTKTSKYLALILFILLPFVSGYVGYMYSPEKVVEVEKVVDRVESQFGEIESVAWSTWFGMCPGYCSHEYTIRESAVIIRSNGRNGEPELVNINDYDVDQWNSLIEKIDVPAFQKLPETIGCPDCADGGGESVTVGFGNGVYKKVSFHYEEYPPGLEIFLEEVRKLDMTLALEKMEVSSCEIDSDCMLVQSDCEDCTFSAINKNDRSLFQKEKINRCELNPPQPLCDLEFTGKVGCIENTCQLIE